MNTNNFLKQSTKKLVFIVLIIPIIIQFVILNLVQGILDDNLYYLTFIFYGMLYFPYFLWLNFATNFFYARSNKYFQSKLINFKVSLFINIIAIFNFVFFVAYIFKFVSQGGKPDTNIITYMLLIQFIGVISFFYNSYFVCKLIATIELKRNVNFIDFAGNLVAFAFPPIALWIIQKKVKTLQ